MCEEKKATNSHDYSLINQKPSQLVSEDNIKHTFLVFEAATSALYIAIMHSWVVLAPSQPDTSSNLAI